MGQLLPTGKEHFALYPHLRSLLSSYGAQGSFSNLDRRLTGGRKSLYRSIFRRQGCWTLDIFHVDSGGAKLQMLERHRLEPFFSVKEKQLLDNIGYNPTESSSMCRYRCLTLHETINFTISPKFETDENG